MTKIQSCIIISTRLKITSLSKVFLMTGSPNRKVRQKQKSPLYKERQCVPLFILYIIAKKKTGGEAGFFCGRINSSSKEKLFMDIYKLWG